MPPARSAGCLVHAVFDGEDRFLIVHPSGWYNRNKPWSVPKGLLEAGEDPETTAVRETQEETGVACRIVHPLGENPYQKSRKVLIVFLAEALSIPSGVVLEPGDWENDKVEFVSEDEARERLHPDQRVFVDRALEHLRSARG